MSGVSHLLFRIELEHSGWTEIWVGGGEGAGAGARDGGATGAGCNQVQPIVAGSLEYNVYVRVLVNHAIPMISHVIIRTMHFHFSPDIHHIHK